MCVSQNDANFFLESKTTACGQDKIF